MKYFKSLLLALIVAVGVTGTASAQGLTDLLKGGTVGNILSGVFSRSDIKISDIAGEYESTGPAITFQGDNFLKKAGGVAAAATIETKLEPYYKQYGLTGAKMTINYDGTFELVVKKITLKGEIEETGEKGIFNFKFKAFGKISLGSVKTYIEQSYGQIHVMFDATKMKTLVSTIGNFTGIKLAKALSSILDSYDGLCVGFKFDKTGKVENPNATETQGTSGNNVVSNILNGIFNQGKNSTESGEEAVETVTESETVIEETPANENTENSQGSSSGLGTLINILKKK